MASEVLDALITSIIDGYNSLVGALPLWAQSFINLFLIVLVVLVYVIFIWKLYRFVSKKNIIGLDLNKYNKTNHPFFTKLLAGTLYFAEYVLILPFFIFFWFAIFAFFLILLTENLGIGAIITIAAVIVTVIRVTSYYKEQLSAEIAKLIPFTLLAFSFLNPNFFSIERILNGFSGLPDFINSIFIYLIFIILLELVLRFFDFVFSLFGLEEEKHEEEEEVKAGDEVTS